MGCNPVYLKTLHCRIACELLEDDLMLPRLFTMSSHTAGTGCVFPARPLSIPVVCAPGHKQDVMFLHSPFLNSTAESAGGRGICSLPEEAPKQKKAELGDSQGLLVCVWFLFVYFPQMAAVIM